MELYSNVVTIFNNLVVKCPHCATRLYTKNVRNIDEAVLVYCQKCDTDILIIEK